MSKLTQLIDSYLVPVYREHGWVAVAVLLAIVGLLVIAATYLGYGSAVVGLFQSP